VYFCGTILAVARTGRYPAICPWMPGLSSQTGGLRDYPAALSTILLSKNSGVQIKITRVGNTIYPTVE